MIMGVSPAIALTVAVFFMSITRSEWIQLWAGLLGAIPAAVISAAVAAGVAVTVLGRTNEHQQKLAAKAALEQRESAARQMDVQQRLAEQQLIEQRELSEQQLNEQRKLAEQQLAEQRTEANLVRERDAIAEVVILNEGFARASELSFAEVRNHLNLFQSAIARWRVELGNGEMQGELLRWTHVLFTAAGNRAIERFGGRVKQEEAAWDVLNEAIASFSAVLLAWPKASTEQKQILRERLRTQRAAIVTRIRDADPDILGRIPD